jgi:hypothetical protein
MIDVSEEQSAIWKAESDLSKHCWEKFPDQRMGHPRSYHDLGDRKLMYRVIGWGGHDVALVVRFLMNSISELAAQYPGKALYWRRQPEVGVEDDVEAKITRAKASIRVAIDHPDFCQPLSSYRLGVFGEWMDGFEIPKVPRGE